MRILVVEDEKDMASAIAEGLGDKGYAVDIANDGAEALEIFEINRYDLLLLDLNLPKIDGLEVCRKIRAAGSPTGILILTARSSPNDCVTGLDVGADDYITKPFNFPELLARIRAVLRRHGEPRDVILTKGDLHIDPNTLKTFYGGREVALTVKEFAILEYLLRNAGRITSAEELIEHIWNEESNPFTQALPVHINNIRNKISAAGGSGIIITVKGKGYLIP
jgi:DNA-binding response OmpR family regulator